MQSFPDVPELVKPSPSPEFLGGGMDCGNYPAYSPLLAEQLFGNVNMKLIPALLAISAFTISGCETKSYNQDDVDAAVDAFLDFEDLDDGLSLSATDLPTSGKANYTGSIILFEDDSSDFADGVFGQLDIAADFSAKTANGEASRFVSVSLDSSGSGDVSVTAGSSMDGTLALATADIVSGIPGSFGLFVSTLEGTLTDTDDNEHFYDTDIAAQFVTGGGQDYFTGGGEGTKTSDGTATDVFISLVTEKQ